MATPQSPEHRPPPLERPLVRGLIAAALAAIIVGAYFGVRAATDGDGASEPTLSGAPRREGTAPSDEGLGALDSQPPIIGEPAPDFALRTLTGEVVTLSELRGQVVWVNFWATWCSPCKKELPVMQTLYDEKRDAGLEILAVNWQDPADDARAYFDSRGLTLPALLDRRGEVYDQYRLNGLPVSFFIDREGRIAAIDYGSLTETKMRERLAKAGLP